MIGLGPALTGAIVVPERLAVLELDSRPDRVEPRGFGRQAEAAA